MHFYILMRIIYIFPGVCTSHDILNDSLKSDILYHNSLFSSFSNLLAGSGHRNKTSVKIVIIMNNIKLNFK